MVYSQKEMILKHMKLFGSIDPITALREYGCFRLAARIAEIREEHEVKTSMIERTNMFGKKISFASYTLILVLLLLPAVALCQDNMIAGDLVDRWGDCCDRAYERFLVDEAPYGAFDFRCWENDGACTADSSMKIEDFNRRAREAQLIERFELRINKLEQEVERLKQDPPIFINDPMATGQRYCMEFDNGDAIWVPCGGE